MGSYMVQSTIDAALLIGISISRDLAVLYVAQGISNGAAITATLNWLTSYSKAWIMLC